MAYKIIYKKRYLNNIEKLIFYLRAEWSEVVATELIQTINIKISQISSNPYLGSLQGRTKVRSIIITKHHRLYYRIQNSTLIIMNLLDMRINPKRNPYNKK